MCQNSDFAPVHQMWRGGAVSARRETYADELVNVRPPYFVPGGIEDALRASGGEVLLGTAREAAAAGELFAAAEGVNIEPAAAVAVACLRAAVAAGRVPADAVVLLNITGGGRLGGAPARPSVRLDRGDPGAVERVAELCAYSAI